MHEVKPGDILFGKYRVEEVIGVGGMGRVVRASHLYLQQPVAIKILLPQMAESQSTVARFLREAQSTVRLRSEHIARVMDVGTMQDGTPFMVMEYLEGYDLNQILRHHGPQLPGPVVDLMLQACEGMAEAHAMGIVHRDIKPSNFFITRRLDGTNLLKILDFGISKTPAEISELTGTQTVIGTPTYMAPEQMVSARSTDPRSDIWSIGVVMYQLLTGRPPFEAETYAQLVLKVGNEPPAPMHVPLPPGLQDIVFRCLEKDPKNRIQNVGELARMLAPYASDPAIAQQSAERASRILATRNAQPSGFGFETTGVGGLDMPPALTPKSWNQTGGSSLSGSVGQFGTKVVRTGHRGLVIAGVATLCVLAGIGGFMVAGGFDGEREQPDTSAPKSVTLPSRAAAQPAGSATPAPPTAAGPSGSAAPKQPAVANTATETPAKPTPTVPTVPTVPTTKSDRADANSAKASDDTTDDKVGKKRDNKSTTKADTTAPKTTQTKSTKSTKSTESTKPSGSTPTKTSTTKKDDFDDLFDERR